MDSSWRYKFVDLKQNLPGDRVQMSRNSANLQTSNGKIFPQIKPSRNTRQEKVLFAVKVDQSNSELISQKQNERRFQAPRISTNRRTALSGGATSTGTARINRENEARVRLSNNKSIPYRTQNFGGRRAFISRRPLVSSSESSDTSSSSSTEETTSVSDDQDESGTDLWNLSDTESTSDTSSSSDYILIFYEKQGASSSTATEGRKLKRTVAAVNQNVSANHGRRTGQKKSPAPPAVSSRKLLSASPIESSRRVASAPTYDAANIAARIAALCLKRRSIGSARLPSVDDGNENVNASRDTMTNVTTESAAVRRDTMTSVTTESATVASTSLTTVTLKEVQQSPTKEPAKVKKDKKGRHKQVSSKPEKEKFPRSRFVRPTDDSTYKFAFNRPAVFSYYSIPPQYFFLGSQAEVLKTERLDRKTLKKLTTIFDESGGPGETSGGGGGSHRDSIGSVKTLTEVVKRKMFEGNLVRNRIARIAEMSKSKVNESSE